jgi:hypothetical protein
VPLSRARSVIGSSCGDWIAADSDRSWLVSSANSLVRKALTTRAGAGGMPDGRDPEQFHLSAPCAARSAVFFISIWVFSCYRGVVIAWWVGWSPRFRASDLKRSGIAEARCERPFSHTVPKTLGAVSITLWCPLRGGLPLCRL